MDVRVGDLNKRVELQYAVQTTDNMGGYTTVWTKAASVWAAIWPTSANEVVQANSTTLVVTHRIRIRYYLSLKASWRIKYGTRYFSIISIVNPNEKGQMQDLMVQEAQ